MRSWLCALCALFSLDTGPGILPAAEEQSAAPVSPSAPIALFNGRDLEGLTTWLHGRGFDDPAAVFIVHDGLLRISGAGFGYIRTRRPYQDYIAVLEWRWGDQRGLDRGARAGKALDSGLFLHAIGPDGNSHDGDGAYRAAIECNLFEGACGDLLLIRGDGRDGNLLAPRLRARVRPARDAEGWPWWDPEGEWTALERWGRLNWRDRPAGWEDIQGFRSPGLIEKRAGEWNRLVCLCRGGFISVELNGVKVNEAHDCDPRGGDLMLQCEGAEILVRRWELMPLP
ncbi:MAG TPA: DUF1080 domain-containing protein [Verrucomicrobiales bacterium]|nr:DUF1080 domain-containing protein [Verrucomicrobiales bacterium]